MKSVNRSVIGAALLFATLGMSTDGAIAGSFAVDIAPRDTPIRPPISFFQSHANRVLDCAGASAEIVGDHNDLTLLNCSRVLVPGNGNRLQISLTRGARMDVSGEENSITYRPAAGDHPFISVLGLRTKLSPAV